MNPKGLMKWIVLLAVTLGSASASASEPMAPLSQQEKISYGIGVGMARNFKVQGIQVAPEMVMRGLKDTLSGEALLLTDEDLQKTMTEFQTVLVKRQAQARQQAMEKNKKEEDAFLADNVTKTGVTTLPSGLQYKIIKEGDGKKPTRTDTVECHYRGVLINGTEFDSSYRTGKTAVFKVAGVIPGWTEALQLMPAGSRWQLFIPSRLAYGASGAGQMIEPNAMLIFDVELIAVK